MMSRKKSEGKPVSNGDFKVSAGDFIVSYGDYKVF